MIATLLAQFAPAILAAVALLVAFMGYGAKQRANGRKQAQADAVEDSNNRQELGNEAANDLRGVGRDGYIDSVRKNDGRWD